MLDPSQDLLLKSYVSVFRSAVVGQVLLPKVSLCTNSITVGKCALEGCLVVDTSHMSIIACIRGEGPLRWEALKVWAGRDRSETCWWCLNVGSRVMLVVLNEVLSEMVSSTKGRLALMPVAEVTRVLRLSHFLRLDVSSKDVRPGETATTGAGEWTMTELRTMQIQGRLGGEALCALNAMRW